MNDEQNPNGPRLEMDEELTFCVNHPNVETILRCNRCNDPICVRCAKLTPVGYRCKKCLQQQQAVFYTGLPVDYVIVAVISLVLAAGGAYFVSFLGFFLAFFVSPAAGALVADLSWRAVGRRRSRYLWVVVCASIVVATMGVVLLRPYDLVSLGLYIALAVSAAYSRLRMT
jgi:phosphatidylserine synthase